jgi:hypothetical protein
LHAAESAPWRVTAIVSGVCPGLNYFTSIPQNNVGMAEWLTVGMLYNSNAELIRMVGVLRGVLPRPPPTSASQICDLKGPRKAHATSVQHCSGCLLANYQSQYNYGMMHTIKLLSHSERYSPTKTLSAGLKISGTSRLHNVDLRPRNCQGLRLIEEHLFQIAELELAEQLASTAAGATSCTTR